MLKISQLSEEPNRILSLVHPNNYLHLAWRNPVLQAAVDLASTLPVGAKLVLVDDDLFGDVLLPGREVRPFIERDGVYAGPPSDDAAVIDELHCQISHGARYLAFGWPSFWQLKHFRAFNQHLRNNHRVLVENDRLILFELCS